MFLRYSLRTRLLYGLGLMLVPLVLLMLVSFWLIDGMFNTMENIAHEAAIELDSATSAKNHIDEIEQLWLYRQYRPVDYDAARFKQLVSQVEQEFRHMTKLSFAQEEERHAIEKSFVHWRRIVQLLQFSKLDPEQRAEIETGLSESSQQVDLVSAIALAEIEEAISEQLVVRQRVVWLFLLTFLLGGGAVFGIGVFQTRSILKPLRALEAGARQLGEGELSFRVTELSTDELGDLARTFNGMAQKLEKNHRALQSLSILDYLTGLNNVREFYRLFHEEARRAERYDRSFTLLLIDLDHFKQVNDRLGHQAGDQLLQEFAERLRELVRASDYAARIGGDEFAVILPETEKEAAEELAERIRQSIEADPLRVEVIKGMLPVTVSIGMATYPENARDADGLFAAADQALYRAKQAGRNQLQSV